MKDREILKFKGVEADNEVKNDDDIEGRGCGKRK
jgi:hypothetical protein